MTQIVCFAAMITNQILKQQNDKTLTDQSRFTIS